MPTSAIAGSYPMYQCTGANPTVATGWSVYSYNSDASTVLSNACPGGGSIGDYVFSNGQPGAVTENGNSGSQVGLALAVPASAPDVTIQAITATANVSPVSGDDAFLGFSSAGQSLPGAAELPYGTTSDYTAAEQWLLPQGARDFQAFVNCTTDHSDPTCQFRDSVHVPALSNLTMTLADNVAPTVGDASGTLASAAAAGATVSGTRTLSFAASDADSGVRSAAVTLSPEGHHAPYTSTIDYGPHCRYDAWNACPLTQSASTFSIDTSALAQDTYAVQLSSTDAAGNSTSRYLGTVTTKNVPHIANGLPCAGPQLSVTANGRQRLGPLAYGRRVLARGWLHCGQTPIPGAEVDVRGSGRLRTVLTNAQGVFTYRVPVGPSRRLSFSYFAYSDDHAPVATAVFKLDVFPVISLRIGPRRTRNGGTIWWRGRVWGGPFPRVGLTLLVQVRAGRRWQTFDQLVTHDGRFGYVYTFLRTTSATTYVFRVALPSSGAAGYDYLPAHSPTSAITVLP